MQTGTAYDSPTNTSPSIPPPVTVAKLGIYPVIIFLGAFLLFQIQPMIARYILPRFGGTAATWSTCLLFFQALLLGGYLYSHGVNSYLAPRQQRILHLIVAAATLLTLRFAFLPPAALSPLGDPTWQVLSTLALLIGAPYLLLSTTSPLMQAWYVAEAGTAPDGSARPIPTALYALSNIGSFAALITYPVFVEPNLTLHQQLSVWCALYCVFVVSVSVVAWRGRERETRSAERQTTDMDAPRPRRRAYLVWAGLAACSSTLLMAVTNQVTQFVAPIPYLWAFLLGLYLLSFVVCFGAKGWAWKPWMRPILPISVIAMTVVSLFDLPVGTWEMVGLYGAALFLVCIVCHGELALLKPGGRYLTGYYLMISVGGVAAGIFVDLIAPHIYQIFYELVIGIIGASVIALAALYRETSGTRWRAAWLLPALAVVAGTGVMAFQWGTLTSQAKWADRNFYGTIAVVDEQMGDGTSTRFLYSGKTIHGAEHTSPELQRIPLTYYGPESGIGRAIQIAHQDRQTTGQGIRLGVVGLGAGTLATYGERGDTVEYYEINPLMSQAALEYFNFLKSSKATVSIQPGDGRITLAAQPPQTFDVLAIDAFSGDAVPMHLLTLQAFKLYFRHLAPNGVLALHLSNSYFNLSPVAERAAAALGKAVRLVIVPRQADDLSYTSEWVLIANDPHYFDNPLLAGASMLPPNPDLRVWTDDYTDMFDLLRR